MSTEILERIKSRCAINDNGCWVWAGTAAYTHKPRLKINGKNQFAHRAAYKAFHEVELPSSVFVYPSCDNPLCCNPEHLCAGNNSANYIAKHGEIKNGFNSGDTYVHSGKPRNSKICPAKLNNTERVQWYKDNAVTIDTNGCWIWDKEISKEGYGKVRFKGKKYYTHRLFWALANDAVDELDNIRDVGQVFRHLCDNKACCNPKHVVVGSRSENAIDAMKYSKAKKYNEDIVEWLFLYEFYLNEGGQTTKKSFSQGLRQLGLVSENIREDYILDILRGRKYKYIHNEFFDWTPVR